MATISITVPDAVMPRVIEAYTTSYAYQATLPDGTTNPQTSAQFTREAVINGIKSFVRQYEVEKSTKAAAQSAADKANAELLIT